MRCTGCGLPLSPQRTHCPRCGKAAGEPEAQAQNQLETPQYAFSPSPEQNNVPAGVDAPQRPSATTTQQQTNNEMAGQPFPSSEIEQSPVQPDQLLLPDPDKTPQSTPEQLSSSQPTQRSASPATFSPFPHSPQKPEKSHSKYVVQPGFTLAALCVLSGGLILLLVYIISLRLPPLSAANLSPSTVANTSTAQSLPNGSQGASLPGATATTQLPTVTPTPSLPGKAYIDNAQIGSGLDLNTAQLSQVTTNFTVNQKIFVTFMLHPVNSGGAVCLLWYVNQKQFSQFTFAVGPVPQNAYSFAFANSAGQGSVSIYWASSTACTDKMLAQVVNFTINP